MAQVAKNLGISEWCLRRRKGQADIGAGRHSALVEDAPKMRGELARVHPSRMTAETRKGEGLA